MSGLPKELRVLLIPFESGDLMLPTTGVAEIVRLDTIDKPSAEAPPWLAGAIEWRGRQVPLTRPAEPGPPQNRLYAVVCFALGADARLPFIAIESRGLPQLERIAPDSLAPETNRETAESEIVVAAMRLGDRSIRLLDIEEIERRLLD